MVTCGKLSSSRGVVVGVALVFRVAWKFSLELSGVVVDVPSAVGASVFLVNMYTPNPGLVFTGLPGVDRSDLSA